MQNAYHRQAKRKLMATIVTLIVIAGVVIVVNQLRPASAALNSGTQTTTATSATPSQSSSSGTTTTPSTTSTGSSTGSSSATGTYTATAGYYVPHGEESIQVNLTLSSGVITDVSIENSEGDHESARFQEEFAASYKSAVVGQKIAGLQLRTIAGASDTTAGFNDAISQIADKVQA